MIKPTGKPYSGAAGERKRLREWLIDMIDGNNVPGLRWLEKERGTFRITWKHAGKPDFELEKDAVLFREWAKHTGKYKQGEQPDPSTWKTRFRCALHKMPDVEEVKIPHSLDHPTDPYRVFKLLPKLRGSQSPKGYSVSPKPGSPQSMNGRCQKKLLQEFQPSSEIATRAPNMCTSSYELKGRYFFGDQFSTINQGSQPDIISDERYDDWKSIEPTIGLYSDDYAHEVTISTSTSPHASNNRGMVTQGESPDKPLVMNTFQMGNAFSHCFFPPFSIKQDCNVYPNSNSIQANADMLKMELNALLSLQLHADM